MPIFNRVHWEKAFLAALLGAVLLTAPVHAFDPETTLNPDDEPKVFLRFGMSALKRGDFANAVEAFQMGAKKNDLASQWKLARMLQRGDGVSTDHVAAYKLYVKIANRFAERAPRGTDIVYVSSAVVSLGRYSMTGIKGSPVRRDLRRAESFFQRAAALYKDPNAQYELGKLYRSGVLGVKQPKSAVRWFGLAAKKGHAPAQAQLGEMLYYGEGVRRRSPVRGLVWMTRAATRSGAHKSFASIGKMQRKALAQASAAQRAAAEKIIRGLNLKQQDADRKSYALELKNQPGLRPAAQIEAD